MVNNLKETSIGVAYQCAQWTLYSEELSAEEKAAHKKLFDGVKESYFKNINEESYEVGPADVYYRQRFLNRRHCEAVAAGNGYSQFVRFAAGFLIDNNHEELGAGSRVINSDIPDVVAARKRLLGKKDDCHVIDLQSSQMFLQLQNAEIDPAKDTFISIPGYFTHAGVEEVFTLQEKLREYFLGKVKIFFNCAVSEKELLTPNGPDKWLLSMPEDKLISKSYEKGFSLVEDFKVGDGGFGVIPDTGGISQDTTKIHFFVVESEGKKIVQQPKTDIAGGAITPVGAAASHGFEKF